MREEACAWPTPTGWLYYYGYTHYGYTYYALLRMAHPAMRVATTWRAFRLTSHSLIFVTSIGTT